ncbi:phytoene desaturase family protein [Pontibacter liquoris]|uniref:phytoene desaturase family protein n=1 Tax=Pontibacter liquoris TaxID=2905677 RepID=UPI001FA71391|nr:NAD(P)/FAD-dependent oxidoreductase [Pontibacter liquoris]
MKYDVVVIGAGFGSLTAAALLARRGLQVCVLEQAKYPGGCSASYRRKGYWFETGATTLVGLDAHMPLHYLLAETGIRLPVLRLQTPMQVHLPDGQLLTRYPQLEDWIAEAERVFGKYNQRPFWEHCYTLSQQVWRTSLQQQSFPASNTKDLLLSAARVRPMHLRLLPAAFQTMEQLLSKYKLLQNELFVAFVNEQLLITAQNYLPEVNALFRATALCYTLYGNYYVPGGMINLVKPLEAYLTSKGNQIMYGQQVKAVTPTATGYRISTGKTELESRFVISGMPLNNTRELFTDKPLQQKLSKYTLPSEKLWGAFTMSVVLQQEQPEILHHQVHIPGGIPLVGSKSIFVSFSHKEDKLRAPAGEVVASISTHLADPVARYIEDKEAIAAAILEALATRGLIDPQKIKYMQAATPGAWLFWTKRAYGAVGGYPQYRHIKPWQMKDARLDHRGAYLCGDTVYPGQGIPGVCLSGIIAANKLWQDHF